MIANVVGAVEQTTRGIMNCKKWLAENNANRLGFPVLSVATSQLKGRFEPPYIGRAVLRNVDSLTGHLNITGKNVAILGCGTIGQQVAVQARQQGANVTIFDPSAPNRLWANQNGFQIAETAAAAVANALLIVGCSGGLSVNSSAIASLRHGAYVLSASSELYEIDIAELDQQSRSKEPLVDPQGKTIGTTFWIRPNNRQINLLANGYPINFWGMNSMPDEAADLILSLIFLAAIELAAERCSSLDIDDAAINDLANRHDVAGKFLEFHQQG